MSEEWKDIAGFEGIYQISNLGRVRSLDRTIVHAKYGTQTRKGLVRKQFISHKGYKLVILRSSGCVKGIGVHRLVAEAFIPNPDNKPQVNHKNGIKHDNAVTNLEWNTQSENAIHSFKTGLQKIISGSEHRNCKAVSQYDANGTLINTYPSGVIASKETGIDKVSISRVCLGKSGIAGGYKWSFAS